MRNMRCLLLAIALGGCVQLDPFHRDGMWRPTGANAANLRAMVENPAHLDVGVGAARTDGQVAAGAVDRLRRDRVKPLPDTRIVRIGGGGAAAAGN